MSAFSQIKRILTLVAFSTRKLLLEAMLCFQACWVIKGIVIADLRRDAHPFLGVNVHKENLVSSKSSLVYSTPHTTRGLGNGGRQCQGRGAANMWGLSPRNKTLRATSSCNQLLGVVTPAFSQQRKRSRPARG